MNRRHFAALAGALFAAPLMAAATKKSSSSAKRTRERVVLQTSDSEPKRWNLVLTTAKTLQKEYGDEKIVVEIVAFGPGVNMLKTDSEVANRVANALGRGILVTACAASLKAHNIDEEDLVKYVTTVTSGVVHIVQRQRSGWLYLKP